MEFRKPISWGAVSVVVLGLVFLAVVLGIMYSSMKKQQQQPAVLPTALPSETATPTATVTATTIVMVVPTMTGQASLTSFPSLTPSGNVGGDWCRFRWTPSCPATWAEVNAVWPEIQRAYGINFILPAAEPGKVFIDGVWMSTACGSWWTPWTSCSTPLKGLWQDPKGAEVWDLGWSGSCHYVIKTACGNLTWKCTAGEKTPVPATRRPPRTPPCPGCNPATPTAPVIPTNTCVTCNQATPTLPMIPTNTPVPPTSTPCVTCNLATPTTPP